MAGRRRPRLSRRARQDRLEAVVDELRRRYGPHIIRSAADLSALPAAAGAAPLSTGSLALDLISGGLPRGGIAEYAGLDGAGKESLAVGALLACQRTGGLALLADVDGACDPDALEEAGVDLDRLLLACPATAAEAWHVLAALGRCGALDLIVAFSLAGLLALPGSGWGTGPMRRGLRRLQVALRGSRTAVLLTNYPLRAAAPGAAADPADAGGGGWVTVGGAVIAQAARLRIGLESRGVSRTTYGDVAALRARATVVKRRGLPDGRPIPLEITAGGPRRSAELIALARQTGLLTETPLGLRLHDRALGRGEGRAAAALEADPLLAAAVEASLRAVWPATGRPAGPPAHGESA